MDRSARLSAAEVVNTYSEPELTRIFRDYGEVREAKKLAAALVKERETEPILTSGRLAQICEKVLSKPGRRTGPPAPTLPFQAIRIEVNRELDELRDALEASLGLLCEGGRITVISFHSLEDRIVKRFFQEMSETCKCPPGCPVCICGWIPKLKLATKHPEVASDEELAVNPRSGCAKLRSAVRINTDKE